MGFELISDNRRAALVLKDLWTHKRLAFDCETDSTRDGFDFVRESQLMYQFGTGKREYIFDLRTVDAQLFKPILENPNIEKLIHTSSFDCTWTAFEHKIFTRNIIDTRNNEILHLGYSFPRKPPKGMSMDTFRGLKPKWSSALEFTLPRWGIGAKLDFVPVYKDQPFTDLAVEYGAVDVRHLHELHELQFESLAKRDMLDLMELEKRVAEVVYKMRVRGFGVDYNAWLKYSRELEVERAKSIAQLDILAPGVNWNAPGQVCGLFGVANYAALDALDPKTLPKDKRTIYSHFQAARKLKGSVQTYGVNWVLNYVADDGRVHCDYMQIKNTGRFSCMSPNLQQIPNSVKLNGTVVPTKHRNFFVAKRGYRFVVLDFKSQELAIMAIGSGEPSWLKALREGKDLHEIVASQMFVGWNKFDAATKKLKRSQAKNINFGVAYGLSYKSLAVRLGISEDDAKDLLNTWHRLYTKLSRWLWENGNFTEQSGVSYSFPPFNRFRQLVLERGPELAWRRKNIGKNNPIQATGADLTKLAMVYMDEADLNVIHQMHDELILEVPTGQANKLAQKAGDCMIQAAEVILGEALTKPDVHVVDNWYQAKDDEFEFNYEYFE